MCSHHHRHPIFCILPPHILRTLAERGSPRLRSAALRTLAIDSTIRAVRAAPGALVKRSQPRAFAEEGIKQRTIYDTHQTEDLPGTMVRKEDDPPTGDAAVDEAYDGLGATYDFYWEIFDRNSIDDEGKPLLATVHYGEEYSNAFWNGEQMVFGDGDGEIFNRFTISLDVIGHELTHGVTEDEAGLVYFYQAGALNEHISDVFGSLVKQYMLGQTAAQADWLIGEGLFTENVNGVALRSMTAPGTAYDDPQIGKDPQPDHMSNYVRTAQDNGGVHINSGIPNRAFYLVAANLGGHAWEKAGRIWYETVRDSRLRQTTGFKRFARLTSLNAERLYGNDSMEQQAVREGWKTVGIDIQ